MPRIRCASVPFLGVQGFMVTKFASNHGVESAAKDLVGNYMMSQASQTALAAANGRYPANTRAGARVSDPTLKAFGVAGRGGVAMPNIPQMSAVWSDLGSAWVKSTKGSGATPARSVLRDRGPQHRKQDRLARSGGAPPGAPPAFRPRGDDRPTRIRPARTRHAARRGRCPRAPSPPSPARSAFAIKIALLAIVNAIALWAGSVLATDENWIALAVLVAATLAIDAVYLSSRAIPLKFLIPGTVFLIGFQIAPIVYNVNVAFTNWSTGHILQKDEAIEGIERNSLSEPPGGAIYVMAPARDEDGDLVLLLVDDATGRVRRHGGGARAASRGVELTPEADDRRGARGLHARPAEPAARARPGARRPTPSRSRQPVRSAPRASRRR